VRWHAARIAPPLSRIFVATDSLGAEPSRPRNVLPLERIPLSQSNAAAQAVFAGAGEMRARCRALDWAATPLGPVESWPQSLRTAASVTLGSRFPSILAWGPRRVQIYNDAYATLIGPRHPGALGRPTHETWPELREVQEPLFARVFAGETVELDDAPYALPRGDGVEERRFDAAFVPVRAEDGAVGGSLSTVFDVTGRAAARTAAAEHARLLAELQGERSLLRTVLDQLPVAVVIAEAGTGRVLTANAAAVEIWGAARPRTASVEAYSAEWRGWHPDGRPIASHEWPLARAVLHGERVRDWPCETERGDGTRVPIEISAAPVHDAAGSRTAAVAVITDVGERERATRENERLLAALRVEQARLEAVFRQAPSFLAVVRGQRHVFELANEAYQRLVGRTDLVGRTVREALPELEGQPFEAILDGVLRTGTPWIGREVRVLLSRTPGAPPEETFVDTSYLPLLEADGSVGGVIAHGMEVTDHVRARRALEASRAEAEALAERLAASEARFRDVFQQAPVAVAVMEGPRHVYSLVTPQYQALVGDRPLRGRALLDAIPEMREQPYPALIAEVFRTGEPVSLAEQVVRLDRDGDGAPEEYVYNLRYTPLRDVSGEVYAVASAAVDVTPQVHARRQLEAARGTAERAQAEAEQANRAKSEFLAVMSHELRTPLNAIGGYAELLEMGIRGPVNQAQRKDLQRIQTSQRHLLGLINEVLNYTRLEAGIVHYDLEDVWLGEALAAAEGLVAPQMRAKGLTLAVASCPPALRARADAEKLRQVLVNLLSNALKFTDRGGRVEMEADAHGGGVRIRVRDTGIGIPPEKREAIFEPFVQVRSDLTRTAEGTGLGLAISRDLARGMGGDLTMESTVGAGSTFTLTLPCATGD
jgi:PAS domain S-box-containing protein